MLVKRNALIIKGTKHSIFNDDKLYNSLNVTAIRLEAANRTLYVCAA